LVPVLVKYNEINEKNQLELLMLFSIMSYDENKLGQRMVGCGLVNKILINLKTSHNTNIIWLALSIIGNFTLINDATIEVRYIK
jgi:hypothetical protein